MKDFIDIITSKTSLELVEGSIITPSCVLKFDLPIEVKGEYLYLTDPTCGFQTSMGIPIFFYKDSVLYLTHCTEFRQDGRTIFVIREKVAK